VLDMSVENPSQHDLEAAYYHGLRTMGDMDPEVAEDLGIPTTPDSFDRHIANGTQGAQTAREAARAADHAYYTEQFGLTGSEPLSSEQRAINATGRAAVDEALADARAKRG
jgi:hypothetical protein